MARVPQHHTADSDGTALLQLCCLTSCLHLSTWFLLFKMGLVTPVQVTTGVERGHTGENVLKARRTTCKRHSSRNIRGTAGASVLVISKDQGWVSHSWQSSGPGDTAQGEQMPRIPGIADPITDALAALGDHSKHRPPDQLRGALPPPRLGDPQLLRSHVSEQKNTCPITATTNPPGLQRWDDLHGAMIIGSKSDKGGSTPIAILSPARSPRTTDCTSPSLHCSSVKC